MNLRNRSLIILGITFLFFFIIIVGLSVSVILSGLDRIESQAMGDSMDQVRSALDAEADSLLITTHDWAWWDDTADFTLDRNMAYRENNANPEAMATLRVHLFAITNRSGDIVFTQLLSPDLATTEPFPDELLSLIRDNPRLLRSDEGMEGISGILLTPGGPMIVASAPVLRSDRSGPAYGTVLMGKYLEPDPLRRIADMTGYGLAIDWPGNAGQHSIGPAEQERLVRGDALVVVPHNESLITGYRMIPDLTGRNLFMSVSTERELRRTGLSNTLTLLGFLAAWAVITALIVALVLDRIVLQRMALLTDHIRSLSDGGVVPTPVLSGDDELAGLERTIITSRKHLHEREQQLRVFINAMPGPAALFSGDGTILLANPAFADYLGTTPEKITGSDYRSCIPKEEVEKYNRFVRQSIQNKEPVHFENDTGKKTYLMSYYPVLNDDGEVSQLGLLAFDITERKQLETALQKVTRKMALLNTVIFSDIQNKVFVQMGYLELARKTTGEPRVKAFLDKEEAVVRDIQSSLSFARQFNDMGMNPPRWQNVDEVMLFALSHVDLGSIVREFSLEGIEIYADALLERVFFTLVNNSVTYAKGSTVMRAGYTADAEGAVIFFEDNGQGIPDDRKEHIFSKGAGAGGSASLFLSREILSVTGITIRENGIAGKGARFEILVPKESYRFTGK